MRARRLAAAMVAVATWLAGAVAAPPALAADPIANMVGARIASVRLVADGAPLDDPSALRAITLRTGDALRMEDVRESLRHLALIERFDRVRVEALPAGDGVDVQVVVTPVRTVTGIVFTGDTGLSHRRLRRAIDERFGAIRRVRRIDDIARLLTETLAQEGFRGARVTPHVDPRGRREAILRFDIAAGPQARIARSSVAGVTDDAEWRRRLALEPGQAWNEFEVRRHLDRELARYRERGYYEIRADLEATADADPTQVDVAVSVVIGPVVTWRFEGDAPDTKKLGALVPIAREGSVDEDLLEDTQRALEADLRAQGYPQARVTYRRDASPGTLAIVFVVARGEPAVLGAITVDGAQAVTAETLLALGEVRDGDPFVQARLDTAAALMARYLTSRGHASAGVAAVATLRPATGAPATPRVADVRFTVVEGPRTSVGTVDVAGAGTLGVAAVRGVMGTRTGVPYVPTSVLADRVAIERLYLNRGFPDVRITIVPTFSADQSRVDLAFTIVEGAFVTVDHLLITGNDRISYDTIAREVPLPSGTPIGVDAIAESQRRLAALGLFRRVRVDDVPEPGKVARDVVVVVEETESTTFGYGVGLEGGDRLRASSDPTQPSEERFELAPRGFVELGRRNLWGKNRSINLFGRASLKQRDDADGGSSRLGVNDYRALVTFREPRAFGLEGTIQATAFVEQAIRSSFNFRRRGVNAEFSQRAASRLTLTGRYSLGSTTLFDAQIPEADRPLIDRLFPQVRLSTWSTALVLDTRDDVLDPSRGWLVSTDLDLAGRRVGSEVGYVKTFTQAFAYRRLGQASRVVVAGGARLGFATGFERTVQRLNEDGGPVLDPDGQPIYDVIKDLPASERFYAGGDTTVRGFALDRLGAESTLDRNGFPSGGNALVIVNGEVRVPVTRTLGGVAFVDAGNVFSRASEFDMGSLRATLGLGARYKSPVGPIRIDVGFKLSRRTFGNGTREDGYAIHVSLGQAF